MALKLEFLEEGGDDCPLIRIVGNDPETCQRIESMFKQLSLGVVTQVSIDALPGIEPIGSCRLTAATSRWDRGVNRRGDEFRWEMTACTWDNLAGLLEPFCHDSGEAISGLITWGTLLLFLHATGVGKVHIYLERRWIRATLARILKWGHERIDWSIWADEPCSTTEQVLEHLRSLDQQTTQRTPEPKLD